MKYFLDTEFHEYHKQVKVAGVNFGKPIPTIELISIGIVSGSNKEYYSVSKEFNIIDAWNSSQTHVADYTEVTCGGETRLYKEETADILAWKSNNRGFTTTYKKGDSVKTYWLRENVLQSIWNDNYIDTFSAQMPPFTLGNFQYLIQKCGKTKKQIASEIRTFVDDCEFANNLSTEPNPFIQFFGYYADYDWVVLAQLFGRMVDLPDKFPWYCNDLQQSFDELVLQNALDINNALKEGIYPSAYIRPINLVTKQIATAFKDSPEYPVQVNEHNALADAKWNKELYNFLINMINGRSS